VVEAEQPVLGLRVVQLKLEVQNGQNGLNGRAVGKCEKWGMA
jgi:hypothetical protein